MCPSGESSTKRKGVLVRNFEKNPKEVPRSYVVGVAWNFFLPLEVLKLRIINDTFITFNTFQYLLFVKFESIIINLYPVEHKWFNINKIPGSHGIQRESHYHSRNWNQTKLWISCLRNNQILLTCCTGGIMRIRSQPKIVSSCLFKVAVDLHTPPFRKILSLHAALKKTSLQS